ncbi:TIR domain-containing protein [Parasphingopyxis algicola]|uniref:TIR domain-containing protein n=1 Tax=Parasphingopyxis algicola TaxID=2026624 RepID=UPI0015A07D52|nr:TIR domain-containing protein [Parasphingopyxis algicola]QLC26632.1 TIR domain-containing protein [Parasphingopyxis algicola]
MVDIFISYSRDNQRDVRRLAEKCRALGYSVWWDEELPPHKSYGDVITEKIGMAKAAIVVWSKTAVASEWVRAEADIARNQKKLIQSALDETPPPLPFNQIQFVMLDDWRGEDDHTGWRKIRESLFELCGPPGDGAAAAEPGHAMPSTPPEPEPEWAEEEWPEEEWQERKKTLPLIAGIGAVVAVIAIALFLRLPGGDETIIDDDAEEVVAEEAVEEEFPIDAVINDSDGFTYMRNAPARGAAVLRSVPDGEVFSTREQIADWWEIQTADGTRGYMHESRIRILGEDEEVADNSRLETSAEDAARAQAEALNDITAAMQGVSDAIESGGNSQD